MEESIIGSNNYIELNLINELEFMEKDACNLPNVFAEILKDEINANDEQRLYNGFKRIIKKYSNDKKAQEVMDETMRVLCGGAAIYEILQVTREELIDPTLTTGIITEGECETDNIINNM